MIKILFFGTPDIAVPSLQTIAALPDYQVVGVGVFPDKKVGRQQVLTPCPVKVAAQKLELPVYEISSHAQLGEVFAAVQHDLALVIAFGFLFPEKVLHQTNFGVVNVHFSLLPQYRGAAPVQQAIIEGQVTSGITWQRMVKALDAGDILWQRPYDIEDKTTPQVWAEFAQLTSREMPSFLGAYTADEIEPQKQDDQTATYCRKFSKADGQLHLATHTAAQIYNHWRALQPWPGVSLNTTKGALKLVEVACTPSKNAVEIKAAEGSSLWLTRAQLPGKPPALMADILRGNPDLLSGSRV